MAVILGRLQDCVILADKVAYSQAIRAEWDKLAEGPNAKPFAISELLDKFPIDARYPWSHGEWAADYSRLETVPGTSQFVHALSWRRSM